MNYLKIALFITIFFVLHLNPVNAASSLSCTQSQVNINKSLQVGGDLSFTGTLTQGNVPWQRLTGDPLNCSGGTYATGLNPGGNLICSVGGGSWLKQGNDIYYRDGNVGIGTDDPKAELDVFGGIRSSVSTDVGLPLTLKNSAVNNTWNIYNLHSKDTSPNALLFENCPSTGDCLRTMTIMPSGKVGIGMTTPMNALLHLGGPSANAGLRLDGVSAGTGPVDWRIRVSGPSPEFDSLFFETEGITGSESFTPKMTIRPSGNVGIGTTTPNAKLDIQGGHVSIGQRFQLGNSQTHWINDPITGFTEPVINNDGFLFVPGYTGAEDSDLRLYITDNVGDRFSIWGSLCAGGDCGDLNKASLVHFFDAGGNAYHRGSIKSYVDSTNGILGALFIEGKNSNATNKYLTQWAFYNMRDYGGANGLNIWEYYDANNNGSHCDFGDTCTSRFSIANGGNVGIGTTDPQVALHVNGDIRANSVQQISDASLKTNIQSIPDSLIKIQQLKGVIFNWKESNDPGIGFLAQEIEPVFPELVTTDATTGLKSVEYNGIIPVLVEAVKDQQKQLDKYQNELNSFRIQIEALRK